MLVYTYTNLLQLADKVLKGFLYNELHRGDYSYFIDHFQFGKNSKEADLLIRALDKLASDGYLKTDGASNNYFNISGEGHQFIEHGGYDFYILKMNDKEGRQDLIEQSVLKTNDSTVSTNKSVRDTNDIQKSNIRWNQKLFWVTLTVAVIAAAGTWMQYFNDSEKNALQKELKGRDSLLQQKDSSIKQKENVLSAQQKIVDSLQNVLNDNKSK